MISTDAGRGRIYGCDAGRGRIYAHVQRRRRLFLRRMSVTGDLVSVPINVNTHI